MKTEAALQKYLRRKAKAANILFSKLESRSTVGWPDVMLIANGQVIFVELKSPSGHGRLSAMQQCTIAEIREHGGKVYVISSQEQADSLIIHLARS